MAVPRVITSFTDVISTNQLFDFFDADIQIPETELQALLPFLAPPPERLAELARRLYLKLIITGARDDLYEHFITKNRLEKQSSKSGFVFHDCVLTARSVA